MQADTEPKPNSVFWQQSQKKQECFEKKKRNAREKRNEDVVERETVVPQPLPYSIHMRGLEAGNTHNSV